MLAFYVISAFVAVATYYFCRRLMLERLRVERPELYPTLRPELISQSPLDAFILGPSSLKGRLDALGLQIDPTSRIWFYETVMCVCSASFYLIVLMGFFALI